MKKVKFIKSAVGFGYGYIAGDIAEIKEKVFTDLSEIGVVEEYTEPPAKQPESDLPVDLPGRKKLIESGVTMLADIEKIGDLTEISGIGKKLNQAIHDFLKDKK